MSAPAQRQLAGYMARYDRPIAALARSALARLRNRVRGATELVYDNYNDACGAQVRAFGAWCWPGPPTSIPRRWPR